MNSSTPNLNLVIKPSKALLFCFIFIYGLAVICILLISILFLIKVIAILLILVSGVYVIKQFALLKNSNSIVKFIASSTSIECKLETKEGIEIDARIKNADWLLHYFAVIVFSTNTKIYKTIIAKDTLSQEQFYALRLYLRSINT